MRKSSEVIINVVFWLTLLFAFSFWQYETLSSIDASIGFWRALYGPSHSLPGLMFNYYVFYLYVTPVFLKKRKFIWLTVSLIIGSIVMGSIYAIFLSIIMGSNITFSVYALSSLIPYVFITLIIGMIGVAMKGFVLWQDSIVEKKVLEKNHLENKTALLLLKAQLNPHFLFNSLNNIDILIEGSPKTASEYLKKLSDILRYVLYETKEDETELAKEIAQIMNYIELQKIRTDNPRYVNFNITGEIKEQKIAPMIFLPFIENAFKHSKNKTIDNAIDIDFEISNSSVKMGCKNYYETNQLEVIKNKGLGIETIKQRLNLLYHETHELIIDKSEHWFNLTLSIKLKGGN